MDTISDIPCFLWLDLLCFPQMLCVCVCVFLTNSKFVTHVEKSISAIFLTTFARQVFVPHSDNSHDIANTLPTKI